MRRIWCVMGSMAFVCIMAGNGYASSAPLLGESAAEEIYTDTDINKGILALRCQVFQGFRGEVTAVLQNTETGHTRLCRTGPAEQYQKNEELSEGEYQLVSVSAISDNREYDCVWEPARLRIVTGKICVVRIQVDPNSVVYFPDMAETATPSQISMDDNDNGISASEHEAAVHGNESIGNGLLQQIQGLLFILGISGFGGCLGWFVWLKKTRR